MAKVYDLNSDEELNGDFGTEYHNNYRGNDNEEHINRAKGLPIKNKKKNKPYFPTVKETFLKTTHKKETNKIDKNKTINTIYNKE